MPLASEVETTIEIVMKPRESIKEYPKNTKKHTEKQVRKIADLIIREKRFNQPIVLDKDDYIVKGHGRIRAAKMLGLENVPCVYQHPDLKDIETKGIRIGDNKVAESPWIDQFLQEELLEIKEELSPTKLQEMTGHTENEIERILKKAKEDEPEPDDSAKGSPGKIVLTCPHCKKKFSRRSD